MHIPSRAFGLFFVLWLVASCQNPVENIKFQAPATAVSKAVPLRTFYVDSVAGADTNAGTQASPWKTLTKVNATTFVPGDAIYLKAGSVWNGQQLYPKGSGSAANPIVIDQYGTGAKPLINANLAFYSAVYFENQQYIEVSNLEVTNFNGTYGATTTGYYAGVHFRINNSSQVYHHLVVSNVYVHDVDGSIIPDGTFDKVNGGIGLVIIAPDTAHFGHFDDVQILNNTITRVTRTGIYSAWCSLNESLGHNSFYYSTNTLIQGNTLSYISGDGIVNAHSKDVVVKNNVETYGCVRNDGQASAGMWPWSCDNVLYQGNEVGFLQHANNAGDMCAWDFDLYNNNITYQFNYSHDNYGGQILIMPGITYHAVFRYNISANELINSYSTGSGGSDTAFYNNVFIGDTGTNYANYTYNNIFYNCFGISYGANGYARQHDNNLYSGGNPISEAHGLLGPALFTGALPTNGIASCAGLTLQAGSQALYSGNYIVDPAGTGTTDFFGNAITAASHNIGIYQGPGTGTAPTTTNVAYGQGGSSDSAQSWNPAGAATDGNTTTRWCAADGNTGHWLQVDLGQDFALVGTEIDWEQAQTYKYKVEASSNGSTWTPVKDNTANSVSSSFNSDAFTATARYLRVTVTGLPSGVWASLYEFKAFSSGGRAIAIDGNGSGRIFEGEGVLSGGGGNTKLLRDYPEPYRSQILDYLFKPNFGASYSELKVELGADVNSTSGTEPSHARTRAENAAPNMTRGYETWLIDQAKKRNPAITLYGLEWGAPGWVGNGNIWSQDNADYIVSYIKGLKNVWGYDMDFIGGNQNEQFNGTSTQARDYIVNVLRPTLNANGLSNVKIIAPDILSNNWAFANQIVSDTALKNAVYAIGYHYVNSTSTSNAVNSGLPIWESEGWTGIGTWNGSGTAGYDGALGLAREMNLNYINAKITKTDVWHLIASQYNNTNWAHSGIMEANTPWSGAYVVQPSVWAAAHTNQFAKPGWRYLDSGSGITPAGGNYVTFKSTDGTNYSIVLVTGSTPETLTFSLSGGLSTGTVHVWESTAAAQFIQKADITVSGTSYSIALEPDAIYSLTTTTGQQKGSYAIPAAANLPTTYTENFESYAAAATPKYLYDIEGAYEVAQSSSVPGGGSGKVLRQVILKPQIPWNAWGTPSNPSTFTEFGDMNWANYTVSADSQIETAGAVALYGRVGSPQMGGNTNDYKGYRLSLYADGTWYLCYGDPYTYETGNDAVLGHGFLSGITANTWHNLKLVFNGSQIQALVDNIPVTTVTDTRRATGMIGLGSSWNNVQFDNLTIVPAATVKTSLAQGKTASADSAQGANPASAGNDGNGGTRWCANDGNTGHWWKVDLGSSTALGGMEIDWEQNQVYKYKIEVSTNNSTWTVVKDRTTNAVASQVNNDAFTATARYVRVTVTGLASGVWASAYEMKVFAP